MASIKVVSQCSFIKENGQQCKRKTSYPKYCYQHLAKVDKVAIKKSSIPGGGKGLFTLKDLKVGDRFDYNGDLVVTDDPDYSGPYVLQTKKNPPTFVNANKTNAGLGRYSNMCRKSNQDAGNCPGNNAHLKTNNRSEAILKLTKNVKAGKEVFTTYGRQYFKR